jgi:Zn-dependent membrane protease YugP
MTWSFYDPLVYLFLLPGLVITIWAQVRVSAAYRRAALCESGTGLSGAETAAAILRQVPIPGLAIVPNDDDPTDMYDPTNRILRLSAPVYFGRSLMSLTISAHETGHALQHRQRSWAILVRGLAIPAAGFGSLTCWIVLPAALLLGIFQLYLAGVVLFSGIVLLQLLSLPIEFDASRRAFRVLIASGLIEPSEEQTVGAALNAAALSQLAAPLTGIIALLGDLARLAKSKAGGGKKVDS